MVVTFTPEQIEKLLATCDTSTRPGFRNYVMFLVFLDTGMRVSELCSLRLSDVHPRHVKVAGKGQKEREIGIHPEVSKLLWKYIHKYRGPAEPGEHHVFLSERGPLSASGVETIFDQMEQQSGIHDVRVSPHTLRHTFSKQYLKRGGDLFKLSRELGHSSVQITGNIYLGDFRSTDARQEHDRYSPIEGMRLGRVKEGAREKKKKK